MKKMEKRRFFKFMMPGFRTRLGIPREFSRQVDGVEKKEATISSCKGLWRIKIEKGVDGNMYFDDGWSDFVEGHELIIGDVVVFKHKGHMEFDVRVFGSDACGKDYRSQLLVSKSSDDAMNKID